MAIQFNCPFCTSQIRVPDSAAGKRGNCPRCHSPILVPRVQTAQQTAPSEQSAGQDAKTEPKKKPSRERLLDEQPDFSGLPGVETAAPAAAASPDVVETPLEVTKFEQSPSVSPPLPLHAVATSAKVDTPYTRALQRRRKRGRFVWIPILFGVVLVGGIALFFLLIGDGELKGTLKAVAVADAEIETRTVGVSMTDSERKQMELVSKNIQESRYQFRDPSGFEYEVTVDGADLQLRVESSDTTPLFRVNVRDDKTLREYLKDHAKTLDEPRERDLKAGLKRFLEGSAESLGNGGQISTEMKDLFKRRVAANILVRGAGYNLIAVIREKAYLCFYEDKQGRLYFPLPKGTGKFTLKGRKLANGKRLFPGNYTVLVGAMKSEPAKKTEPGAEKSNENP